MRKDRAIPFFKIEGAGNDFVLIPRDPESIRNGRNLETFCRTICAPRFGVSADGLLFLWPTQAERKTQAGQRWRWFFLNSDGSHAAFCGNAARAATVWLAEQFPREKILTWETDSGQKIEGRRTGLRFAEVSWPLDPTAAPVGGKLLESARTLCGNQLEGAFLVQAGVPHLVLVSGQGWPRELRAKAAPPLRAHPALGLGGANVTFVRKDGECVSFERGVEGETLACGSGAVAAACALGGSEKTLRFPGGELRVKLSPGRAQLTGPAHVVFKGEWPAEDRK